LLNVFVQLVEVRFDFGFSVLDGIFEFHTAQLIQNIAHGIPDDGPRDLVLGLRRALDGVSRHIVEPDHVLQHTYRLVERTEPVVRGVRVLLQKVLLQEFGDLERDLVGLGERRFTDQLHDLGQVLFFLEDLLDFGTQRDELWEVLVVEVVQRARVLRVRDQPVDGGEVLALGQLLVQPPEHLHDTQSGGGDGIGEVTTGGRDGAHDGHRPLSVGVAQALDPAGALVEGGQPGPQVGGVARIGRHLRQTPRDFSQGLGPTGRGVGHHRHVVTHVAEVLGQGDAGVDGGLSGRHRHVGGVRHQSRTLHDGLGLALDLDRQLGEVPKHLRHFVASLSATDVDDHVGVGVFGERLRDDGLAATEGSGDGRGTTLDASATKNQTTNRTSTLLDATYGKRESRTRCPVNRGWFAGSFSLTGLG
jgi:hypothetical protein